MADETDPPITTPVVEVPQAQSFEVTLLGHVDVGRFLSQEITVEQRTAIQRLIGSPQSTDPVRVAVYPVTGLLTKYGSPYGPSTVQIAHDITDLANSGQYDSILMLIDSPGGEAAFVYDAVDAIRAAGQKIPIHARISDLGASGGYALACACASISINEQGSAGSIGTYIAVQDWSGFMKKMGVKTYVLAAEGGTFKGMGTFGTELTEPQQAYIRDRATAMNQMFLKTVATGRRMSMDQVVKLADGRVHIGAEAVALGLVDAVSSLEESLAALAMSAKPRAMGLKRASQKEVSKMEPATYTQLKEKLPKASAEFLCEQLEKQATLEQAQTAWTNHLQTKLEEAAASQAAAVKAAEEKAKADAAALAAANVKMPGVKLPQQGGEASTAGDDLCADYHEAIREEMKSSGVNRFEAAVRVNKRHPNLHKAYLVECNKGRESGGIIVKAIESRFKIEEQRLQKKLLAAN